MQVSWNWGIFFQQAPFGNESYLGWLLDGALVTVALFLCSWVLAFLVGSFFGILRSLPNRALSSAGAVYVTIFRNIPLIVQFFIWYLVVPELLPRPTGIWFKSQLDPALQFFTLSVFCLGFFTGARICEQVRSGITALSRGQLGAALALGMSLPQAYLHVIMPNTYRIILPTLTSEMLSLMKNTAVAQTIGLVELSAQANRLLEYSNHAYESFVAVTAGYFILNTLVMSLMRRLEKFIRVPTGTMGGAHA